MRGVDWQVEGQLGIEPPSCVKRTVQPCTVQSLSGRQYRAGVLDPFLT